MKSFKHFVNESKKSTGGLKDACWSGYTAVGMKDKNGRKVPNCVPEETQINELKKTTLASYVKGAMADREQSATSSSFKSGAAGDKYNKADETPREVKRAKGIDTALTKLTKEESLEEALQQHTHVTTHDLQFSGHGPDHTVKKGSHLRYVEGSKQMYIHLKNGRPVTKTHAILSVPHEFVKSVNEESLGEDGAAGVAMGVAAVAGSGDSRLPVSQREPGVSKKRNPTLGSIRRRNLPQV